MSSMNFKSQIAPKGLNWGSSDFFISDKYATILTVVSYPKFIAPGYLSTLTNQSTAIDSRFPTQRNVPEP